MYADSDSPSQFLSRMIEDQSVSDIFGDPTLPRHRRLHLEDCRVPGAGAWLTANPSCVESHVPSPLFRVALQRRLRMALWDHDSACSMCGEVLDRWGGHALSCCCGGDRVLRHNAIRNVVCSTVAEFTSVSPELEKPGLLLPRGRPTQEAPTADIWVPWDVSGFAEVWDFSVSSLFRSSHLSSASPSVADVFREVEQRKRAFQDTASPVAECGATFCPLVLEACGGGWSQPFRSVVAWIDSESRTARGLAIDVPRDTSPRNCTAHQLHPSPGKRACNPEAFLGSCQWLFPSCA